MPGQRNDQEDQQARTRVPAPQVPHVPIEQQENKDNAEREDDSDEPLGEHIKSTGCGKAPGGRARRLWLAEGDPEQQHGETEPQADNHVGNEDPRVNENAKRGQQNQGRIEAGHIGIEEAGTALVDHQEQGECSDGQRQAGGPILGPKESEAGCHAPVQERSLFEVTDTVGVEGNPVMPRDHFPRHFGMHRVGIIQQRRTEKRKAPIEQQPKTDEREHYFLWCWDGWLRSSQILQRSSGYPEGLLRR